MDNNGKIYSLLDQASFNQWLTEFFNKKSNELAYSRQNQPKRMEKLVLNLATANTEGYKVPVPFKSCVVSRIYSTSTGTDKAGSIRILFDQPNLGNLNNAVNLFVNDTLKSETLFTESYLLWSAQADTTMELYFFPDLEISTGTTKTQIVGTVSVAGSTRISAPVSATITGTSGTLYTAPANSYAIVNLFINGGTGNNNVSIDGNTAALVGSGYFTYSNIIIGASQAVTISASTGMTANISGVLIVNGP